MAKIAQVGYGSKGQGVGKHPNGYTYVVNDNVRTGDAIQVISTSSAGRKFATTAVPLHTYSENTVKGKTAKIEAEEKGKRAECDECQGLSAGYCGNPRYLLFCG